MGHIKCWKGRKKWDGAYNKSGIVPGILCIAAANSRQTLNITPNPNLVYLNIIFGVISLLIFAI